MANNFRLNMMEAHEEHPFLGDQVYIPQSDVMSIFMKLRGMHELGKYFGYELNYPVGDSILPLPIHIVNTPSGLLEATVEKLKSWIPQKKMFQRGDQNQIKINGPTTGEDHHTPFQQYLVGNLILKQYIEKRQMSSLGITYQQKNSDETKTLLLILGAISPQLGGSKNFTQYSLSRYDLR